MNEQHEDPVPPETLRRAVDGMTVVLDRMTAIQRSFNDEVNLDRARLAVVEERLEAYQVMFFELSQHVAVLVGAFNGWVESGVLPPPGDPRRE